MHKTLTAFSAAKTQPSFDFPRLERLVAGNPQRATWAHFERDGMSAGLWGCEPGAWRIAFADDTDEFFHVLELASASPTRAVSHASSGRARRA